MTRSLVHCSPWIITTQHTEPYHEACAIWKWRLWEAMEEYKTPKYTNLQKKYNWGARTENWRLWCKLYLHFAIILSLCVPCQNGLATSAPKSFILILVEFYHCVSIAKMALLLAVLQNKLYLIFAIVFQLYVIVLMQGWSKGPFMVQGLLFFVRRLYETQ